MPYSHHAHAVKNRRRRRRSLADLLIHGADQGGPHGHPVCHTLRDHAAACLRHRPDRVQARRVLLLHDRNARGKGGRVWCAVSGRSPTRPAAAARRALPDVGTVLPVPWLPVCLLAASPGVECSCHVRRCRCADDSPPCRPCAQPLPAWEWSSLPLLQR
jgi:hypothetical protein